MPRLSILIPCAQEAGRFETTLASVLQNRPHDCEIVVIQPCSYEDPYELKDEVRFVAAAAESSLVDLINQGIQQAEGQIIHLLSCDIEVLENWIEPALRHFEDPVVGSVSPTIVHKSAPQNVLARGVQYTPGGGRRVCRTRCSRIRAANRTGLTPTLAAGFYRRQALLDVGGFCHELGTNYCDIDLGLMLDALGYRRVHEAEAIVVSMQSGLVEEAVSFDAGRAAERLFWRNTSSAQWSAIWLNHPAHWLGDCLRHLHRPPLAMKLLGRLQGWFERGRHSRHQRHLENLKIWKRGRRAEESPLGPSPGTAAGYEATRRAAA